MDTQPKLGGIVKIRFYFGYAIVILKDNGLKQGVQCYILYTLHIITIITYNMCCVQYIEHWTPWFTAYQQTEVPGENATQMIIFEM